MLRRPRGRADGPRPPMLCVTFRMLWARASSSPCRPLPHAAAAQAEKDRARARGASAPGGVGGGMMSDAAERERRREPKRRRYGSAAQDCEHSPVHGRDGFSCPQTFAQFVSNAFFFYVFRAFSALETNEASIVYQRDGQKYQGSRW